MIFGGRALDCAGRMGLGFRPGPETHVLDTPGVQIPRCEDLTRTRKDRAYAFEARLSSLDNSTSRARWGGQGVSDASLHPGDVVAEVRAGLVETAACECGAVETVFRTEPQADPCESCGISKLAQHEESCFACGSSERVGARIGVISLLAAASVVSMCVGGSALLLVPLLRP